MGNKSSIARFPINVSPAEAHRRQMIWQVWVPLAVTILIALTLLILTAVAATRGSPQVDKWGAISAIFLIIIFMAMGIIILALLSAVDFGLFKLLGKVPDWMLALQIFFMRASQTIHRIADAAVRPIMGAYALSARGRALKNHFFGRR